MPMFDFVCPKCASKQELLVNNADERPKCEKCEVEMEKLFGLFGGYKINGNNSASVRPKRAGSFKKGSGE